MSAGPRSRRVAERIRDEIAGFLARGVVKDPRVEGAVVSGVQVSDDLSLATIYVRLLDPSASEGARKDLVAALDRARGFLRRELGKKLSGRRTPQLRFFWDEGVDRALSVERILDDLRRDGELD